MACRVMCKKEGPCLTQDHRITGATLDCGHTTTNTTSGYDNTSGFLRKQPR
ncbi:hypothetical protein DPMN_026571 [Dreissena polymorpha]|uniref:Uncharacterized protein n=1 Tax=Dreissena polymorpha TaxID=45954 RepID=A0A9D4REG0_DREPO|nr:hypothetical protein DPMN_026571 [Dreissena polymorpha]